MTNTKHWSLYYCGYRVMKILNKKKYQDYTERVHIDISELEAQSFHLRSHNMLSTVCSDGTYDEDKENVQAFTHCPMRKTLCVISGGDKDKMTNYINMECALPVGVMYLQYPTRSLRMFKPV